MKGKLEATRWPPSTTVPTGESALLCRPLIGRFPAEQMLPAAGQGVTKGLVGFGLTLSGPQIFGFFTHVGGLRSDHAQFHFELLQSILGHGRLSSLFTFNFLDAFA
jgi:hypothetical protein